MIGRTISHYRIISTLGQGGAGTVYLAEDTRLKRNVALKFLAPGSESERAETERLIREARAASRLDHSNICTIYEIDEVDGEAFIAMACVSGTDLQKRLTQGPLSQDEALEVARQVAEGLKAAHAAGVVHHDIKPANIMLTPEGQVKITDFGIAEFLEQKPTSETASTSGTAAYMSPEQLRGEDADHRSDIWSLGVVLYEMLSGKNPFEGEYAQAVIYNILNVNPEPISEHNEDVAPDVASITARALAKRPEDRYQSMAELLLDLEKAAGQSRTPGERRRPIAVISFENLTGDTDFDYLQRAIPNLLITSLERSEDLRVITWERMRDLIRQLGEPDAATISSDLGFEAARLEGVSALVTGSVTRAGDVFATDAKVLDVKTKSLLASSSSRGRGVDSILSVQVDELSRQILEGLGAEDRSSRAVERPIAEVTTDSMEAYEHFLQGKECYEKLYNTGARKHLEEAVAIDAEFAEAHLYLALTYSRLRQPAARDLALTRAMALSARATRKERLYIEAAHARSIERDRLKEFRILRQLAREFPGEKFVHHRLAGYHRARGELYRAIEEYNQVLALDPEFGWAMNELGYMYTDVGDFEKASEYFERYAAVSPEDANPVDSMGELCFRMGRLDEAIARYKQALELNPDFYYTYWEIAYVSALKGDFRDALNWIENFIEHAPSFGTVAEGHRWRCLYKYWVGRLSDAMSDATLISELASEEGSDLWAAEANRMRAWVHYDRGHFEKARKCVEACLEAVERNPSAFIPAETSYSQGSLEQVGALKSAHLLSLGLIDIAENRLDEARYRLEAMREAAPYDAALLEAEVLMHEDRVEESISTIQGAEPSKIPYMSDTEGMLVYNLPPMRDALARAYAKKGETYKSMGEYEKLTEIRPDSKDRRIPNPRYRVRLAELYESKGWDDRAREQYRAFLKVFDEADDGIEELKVARARAKRHM